MGSAILVLIGFLAVLAMGYGALSIFAGSMSDDPVSGDAAGTEGATAFLIGLVVLIAVIVAALFRH